MNKLLSILLLFNVLSCSSHYDAEEFNTAAIYSVSVKVLQKYKATRGSIHVEEWPLLFEKIGAKSVIIRDDGLYILLNSLFVQEKGLYIPKETVNVVSGSQSDPSYNELKDGVYSYVIKG